MQRNTRRLAATIVLIAGIMGAAGLQQVVAKETEFGLGPRSSAHGVYKATLEPREPLRLRKLQAIAVRIVDANGRPIDGASIAVDGGMPEHNHGLPTQPRVTKSLGGGVYEIDGVRFSMGGWWELKLAIDSPAGADSVTFNLSL